MTMAAAVLFAPVHAALVMAYCAVRFVDNTEHWLVDALSYVLPLLLLIAIVHIPGAIWRRSPFLLSATAIPLIVFGALYGSSYLPKRPPSSGQTSFTVMSYNVWAGNEEYDRIVKAIEDYSPDVVGLQEVTDRIVGEIAGDLARTYPYYAEVEGQALFSRFPIVANEALLIGHEEFPLTVQYAELSVHGEQIGIVNAHPRSPQLMATRFTGLRFGYPSGLARMARDLEMSDLLLVIRDLPDPLIVLGDFNLTDLHKAYGEMAGRLIDAHKQTGYGLGLTRTPVRGVGPATWRIDFVLYTPDLTSNWTKTGAFGGSDHRPVVAELEFRDP